MTAERAYVGVRGCIVLTVVAGRALRSDRRPPRRGDVLGCSGSFQPADRVYVSMRGRDGGQFAIALAISAIEADALRAPSSLRPDERDAPVFAADGLDVFWAKPR